MSQSTLKSFKAVVNTVITTDKEGAPLMKTREDGSQAPYALIGIVFKEGVLNGKSYWAQRTLVNRDGLAKESVVKGDDVFAVLTGIVNKKPFFEVSKTVNATDEDILNALGETVTETVTEEPVIPTIEA